MQINLVQEKTYLVAVSGGVDSVALLDVLVKGNPGSRLVVAHFDHGIRPNSSKDALFVKNLADRYGLDFIGRRAELGEGTSEATAREARYGFLFQAKEEIVAESLITAHHLDDFLETVVLNFHRGCKRRGLVSLQSGEKILRPLLRISKEKIMDYAQENQLGWVEDATNRDFKHLRNYIRHEIMPKFTSEQRQKLISICDDLILANRNLEEFLSDYLRYKSYRRQGQVFGRDWFNCLSHTEACEIVVAWLTNNGIINYTRNQIDYIVVKLKTLKPGKTVVVSSESCIELTKRSLRLNL